MQASVLQEFTFTAEQKHLGLTVACLKLELLKSLSLWGTEDLSPLKMLQKAKLGSPYLHTREKIKACTVDLNSWSLATVQPQFPSQ